MTKASSSLLYETPAGFALLSSQPRTGDDSFDSSSPSWDFAVKAFSKFDSTQEAVDALTALADGKMSDALKIFLKKNLGSSGDKKLKDDKGTLMVADPKLAAHIHKKLGVSVVADFDTVGDAFRQARQVVYDLLNVSEKELRMMTLGLAHSLARYQIKFSPDQVDTMIVQAVNLLDELDKELNVYCMRLREWYGWHFPELGKLIGEHGVFAKLVLHVGLRQTYAVYEGYGDLGIDDALASTLKAAADISMGTDIAAEDLANMQSLAGQVLDSLTYRAELHAYLVDRMHAIAPNLTALVGELVGARLIAHAGSLVSLAKVPASTLQILGAEKALFRALKAKHDTPKYGLLYHASLVGQATGRLKGKMARTLAAKCSLAVRTDAFSLPDAKRTEGEGTGHSMGAANRLKVEERLRQLEVVKKSVLSGDAKAFRPMPRVPHVGSVSAPFSASNASAFSIPPSSSHAISRKRPADGQDGGSNHHSNNDAKKAHHH